MVTPTHVLTALHVVADRRTDPPRLPNGPITLRFRSHATTGRIAEGCWDRRQDWVIIECDQPPEMPPMPLLVLEHSRPGWVAFGFPDANPAGMMVDGDVVDLEATYQGVHVLQLFSRQAGAGDGMPVPGLSGSACVVDGQVIGLLRSSLMDMGRNVGGTLYACPIKTVIAAVKDRLPDAAGLNVVHQKRPRAVQSQESMLSLAIQQFRNRRGDEDLAPGMSLRDGRLELLECVGTSAGSTVWKAFERKHKEVVGVRVLRSRVAEDDMTRELFFKANETMAAMSHEGIVKVLLPRVEEAGLHYMVMQFIGGMNLRSATLSGAIDRQELVRVISRIGVALQYVHDQGAVHGALKPASVLLDHRLRPRLSRFGHLPIPQEFDFRAPEVRAFGPPTVVADVYSYALTAMFALSGRRPAVDLTENVPAALDALPVSSDVQRILRRGLAHNPEDRLQTAGELQAALRRAMLSTSVVNMKRSDHTGDVIDGRFTITGVLGRGSHGTVYRAYEPAAERDVALKVLKPGLSTDRVRIERFLREAEALGRLDHPAIARLYGQGESPLGIFIARELLEGRTLHERIGAGEIPAEEALAIVHALCGGLHSAHEAGLIHRDVHPDNIFLERSSDGTESAVKLADFGVVKFTEGRELTSPSAAGNILGNPAYVSPEQVQGRPLDRRSDVYAVALIAYELLSGARPFPGNNEMELLLAHVEGTPPPFSETAPDNEIPAAVEKAVLAALAKDPADRPQTAHAFSEALRTAWDGAKAQQTEQHSADPFLGKTLAGRYEVAQLIGQGGMGAVYKARQVAVDRLVAVKALSRDLVSDAAAIERFEREMQATSRLEHPHTVNVIDYGRSDGGVPFLVMELLDGPTLLEVMERDGPLPSRRLARIAEQIAQALGAAHDKGIIHRDVKPENIVLLDSYGKQDWVKVLDFGIARMGRAAPSARLTSSGHVVGTPQTISPEQIVGGAASARSDLYALGVVMYMMATGTAPFEGSEPLATMYQHVNEPVPPIESRTDVAHPEWLKALIYRLLAKKPEDRPASAQELLQAIELNRTSELSVQLPAVAPPAAAKKSRTTMWVALALALVVAVGAAWWFMGRKPADDATAAGPSGEPIKVGVLHSSTGTLATNERPMIAVVKMAVAEINAAGGVMGRPLQAVIADTQSDERVAAKEARRLLRDEKVAALFGCWTSACRKAVLPVVEAADKLLFYPLQYEGLEQSKNVFYLGAAPNQQLLPAVDWLMGFKDKKRFFLVGSDYIFPRAANAIIKDELKKSGDMVAGEAYIPLGSTGVKDVVSRIARSGADVILNTINGDSNAAFFRELRAQGITPEKVPTMSFSITEKDITRYAEHAEGDFAAWTWFMSVPTEESRSFVSRVMALEDKLTLVTDPMEAAYSAVHLWAAGVAGADSLETAAVREALKTATYKAPSGPMQVDPTTQHMHKTARIGQIKPDGHFKVVYTAAEPIAPEPFPDTRTEEQWLAALAELAKGAPDSAAMKPRESPIKPLVAPTGLDEAKVALGHKLFHEKRLSADGKVSCSSCHDLAAGGDDGLPMSKGVGGKVGKINSPTVFNAALHFRQFWDGRAKTLEEQIDGPVTDASEMAGSWPDVVAALKKDPTYVKAFKGVYDSEIAAEHIRDAIADFERTLITVNSPFDKYLAGEDVLSADQKAGYEAFQEIGCIECHYGAAVGGQDFKQFGEQGNFLAGRKARPADYGLFNQTELEDDRYKFKVPSLRNVAVTGPWFHDGSATDLQDAVITMARVQLGQRVTPETAQSIVAFLLSLTGEYNGLSLADKPLESDIEPLQDAVGLSPQLVALGKRLYYDKRFSEDEGASCNTCHDVKAGGDNGRKTADGPGGAPGKLNPPTVFNADLNKPLFLNGGALDLTSVINSHVKQTTVFASSWPEVLKRLNYGADYENEAQRVFKGALTKKRVTSALIEYVKSLRTPRSRFDLYMAGEGMLSAAELRGYSVFRERCDGCHGGPNAGGRRLRTYTYPGERSQTKRRVPSLRNITETGPYFHDGSVDTLAGAVRLMGKLQFDVDYKDKKVNDLVAFLKTL